MSEVIGYARVSTLDQDLTRQLEALKAAGCTNVYHGKQSGKSIENEQKLEEMVNYVRKGDTVLVTSLDRLGRSTLSVLSTLDKLNKKGVKLKTLDGNIDTTKESAMQSAMVSLLGLVAELEHSFIVKRTSEGRRAAMARGQKMGRNKTICDKDRKSIRKRVLAGETKYAIAKEFGVSHTTIRRICAEA